MRVLLLLILAFAGCVKNNDGNNINSTLEFNLNGTRIICNVNKNASMPGTVMTLEGSWTNGGSIQLIVWSTAPGTYVFSANECHGATLWQNNQPRFSGRFCGIGGSSGLFGPGSVTVSAVTNDYISGSFEFITEGPDADTITNGTFNLKREN